MLSVPFPETEWLFLFFVFFKFLTVLTSDGFPTRESVQGSHAVILKVLFPCFSFTLAAFGLQNSRNLCRTLFCREPGLRRHFWKNIQAAVWKYYCIGGSDTKSWPGWRENLILEEDSRMPQNSSFSSITLPIVASLIWHHQLSID